MLRVYICILCAGLFSSCASVHHKKLLGELSGFEPKESKIDLKFYEQSTSQCGPTSLYTILKFYKAKHSYEKIKSMTYIEKAKGTHQTHMLAAARRLGFSAYEINLKESFQAVSQNRPTLIFHNLGLSWAPYYHFSVFAGYSLEDEEVLLHDGHDAYSKMSFKKFANTWSRGGNWSYLVVPANTIPKHASLKAALSNASVFDRIDEKSAFKVYTAIVKKWPKSFEAYSGLGRIYYRRKENKKAELNMLKAQSLNPKSIGLNYNLAYLYLKLKKIKKANRFKAKTLALAKDNKKYLETKFKSLGL